MGSDIPFSHPLRSTFSLCLFCSQHTKLEDRGGEDGSENTSAVKSFARGLAWEPVYVSDVTRRCDVETINFLFLSLYFDGGVKEPRRMMSHSNSAHKQNNWIHSNRAIFCWLLSTSLRLFFLEQRDTQRVVSLAVAFSLHLLHTPSWDHHQYFSDPSIKLTGLNELLRSAI